MPDEARPAFSTASAAAVRSVGEPAHNEAPALEVKPGTCDTTSDAAVHAAATLGFAAAAGFGVGATVVIAARAGCFIGAGN